jgi:hypothetical protein
LSFEGILVNRRGERFVNELGLRNQVTDAIFAHGDRIQTQSQVRHPLPAFLPAASAAAVI